VGTLAASMQCWWMAQALRSHSRWWWLVVSSDEMSPFASRSWTSVTDCRLILTCQLRRTTWKKFASSVERILLWSRWQQKHGWTYQKAEFVNNHFSPQYNRFLCFLLQVPQTATTKLCGFTHDYNASFQSSSILHFKLLSTVVRDVIN